MQRRRSQLLALAGALLCGALWPASVAYAGASGDELLPDLKPVPPYQLVVDGSPGAFVIGFGSSAENHGDAELKMRGSRPNTGTPQMQAAQLVQLDGGGERVYRDAGVFQFVTEVTHRHWHWLRFMRYELRRASNYALGNPDVKSGFCVADRKRVAGFDDAPQNFPDPSWCEQDNPSATKLVVGLSVGWGDPYDPLLEGQAIELSGLPAGKYYLVHHVNPERLIREKSYRNNYSAALVELSWPRGTSNRPRVDELVSCAKTGTPGKDRLIDTDGAITPVCGLAGNDTIRLATSGPDLALGGPGNDTISGALSSSTLDGGAGNDTARYVDVDVGLDINLRQGVVESAEGGDTLVSIERAVGGPQSDRIRGSRRANVLAGGRGHDTVHGGAGPDLVRGGSGRDVLSGGTGPDRLIGGPGNDRLESRDRARDIVRCGAGFDVVVADRRDVVAADCEDVRLG